MEFSDGRIAALDVGTSKICCFIAQDDGEGVLRITGIGHHAAHGMKRGAIVDADAAEGSIRAAVHTAEQMAGVRINSVIANLSTGVPRSRLVDMDVTIGGHQVGDADIRRIMDRGRADDAEDDRVVLHSLAVGYTIDGLNGIRNPRGLYGERLGARVHVVSALRSAARTLISCIERCHLEVEALVVSPYASALACLVEDELELGAVCIDMGAGTTDFAVFQDGKPVHIDMIPVGGSHVTNDIARAFSTPLAEAERLKTLFGAAIEGRGDDRQVIDAAQLGEHRSGAPVQIRRAELVAVIRPRLEETFELVAERLEQAGYGETVVRRAVLTGRASELTGAREVAEQILKRRVRLGRPRELRGLAESTSGPGFAACAGLLVFGFQEHVFDHERGRGMRWEFGGRWGRLGQWIREHF